MKKMHAETLGAVGRAAMRLALSTLALVLVSQQPPARAQQHLRDSHASVEINWSVLDELSPAAPARHEPNRAVDRTVGQIGKTVVAPKSPMSSARVGPKTKSAKKAVTISKARSGAKTATKPVDACGRPAVRNTSAAAGPPEPIKPAIQEPVVSSAALGGSPAVSPPHAQPSSALPSAPPSAPIALGPQEVEPSHRASPSLSGSGTLPVSETAESKQ